MSATLVAQVTSPVVGTWLASIAQEVVARGDAVAVAVILTPSAMLSAACIRQTHAVAIGELNPSTRKFRDDLLDVYWKRDHVSILLDKFKLHRLTP